MWADESSGSPDPSVHADSRAAGRDRGMGFTTLLCFDDFALPACLAPVSSAVMAQPPRHATPIDQAGNGDGRQTGVRGELVAKEWLGRLRARDR